MGTSRIFEWDNPPGTPFASYAALVAGTSGSPAPINGDKATVAMGGRSTQWQYDGTLLVWRIQEAFITTSTNASVTGNIALAGMQEGDWITCTDNGTKAQWSGVAYQFLT